MEFGSSMEITSDGHISWYIGADGGTGTYSLSGDILSADMTNDFDQSSMKMEFTAEKTDDGTFLYTEYKGLLLCWSQGEGETGKGGDDEAESGYPGVDVVELVNLRGDTSRTRGWASAGIKLKRAKGMIRIAAWREGDHVVLQVADNGVGMTAQRLAQLRGAMESDQRVGFGLSAVNQRLRLQFGPQYGLEITSREGEGTTVTARIPYTEKEARP